MSLESVDYQDFTPQAQSTMDDRLLVKFYIKPFHDKRASVEAGRPVYVDREHISIRVPGSRNEVARPARAADKSRFSRHYEAFKKRLEVPIEGTPLSEWPLLPRSGVEEMAFYNIKTVEQLANVADSAATNFKRLLNWKRRAQEWLELAESDAPLVKLNAELEQRDAKIAVQQNLIDGLTKRLEEIERNQRVQASVPEQAALIEEEPIAAPPPIEPPPMPETVKRRRGRPRKHPIKE